MKTLLTDIAIGELISKLPPAKQPDVKELLKIFFSNAAASLNSSDVTAVVLAKLSINDFLYSFDDFNKNLKLETEKLLNNPSFTAADIVAAHKLLTDIIERHLVAITKTISGIGNIDEVINLVSNHILPHLKNKTNQTHELSQLEQSTF